MHAPVRAAIIVAAVYAFLRQTMHHAQQHDVDTLGTGMERRHGLRERSLGATEQARLGMSDVSRRRCSEACAGATVRAAVWTAPEAPLIDAPHGATSWWVSASDLDLAGAACVAASGVPWRSLERLSTIDTGLP